MFETTTYSFPGFHTNNKRVDVPASELLVYRSVHLWPSPFLGGIFVVVMSYQWLSHCRCLINVLKNLEGKTMKNTIPSLKLTVSHLKIDGWWFPFGMAYFQGLCYLVLVNLTLSVTSTNTLKFPSPLIWFFTVTWVTTLGPKVHTNHQGSHGWSRILLEWYHLISLAYLFHQQGSSWNTLPKTKSKSPWI